MADFVSCQQVAHRIQRRIDKADHPPLTGLGRDNFDPCPQIFQPRVRDTGIHMDNDRAIERQKARQISDATEIFVRQDDKARSAQSQLPSLINPNAHNWRHSTYRMDCGVQRHTSPPRAA